MVRRCWFLRRSLHACLAAGILLPPADCCWLQLFNWPSAPTKQKMEWKWRKSRKSRKSRHQHHQRKHRWRVPKSRTAFCLCRQPIHPTVASLSALCLQGLPREVNAMMLEMLFKQFKGFLEARMVPGVCSAALQPDAHSAAAGRQAWNCLCGIQQRGSVRNSHAWVARLQGSRTHLHRQ